MQRSVLMVALLVAGVPAYAQNPVSTDGTKYKVIFENARVRVLEYRDLSLVKVHWLSNMSNAQND